METSASEPRSAAERSSPGIPIRERSEYPSEGSDRSGSISSDSVGRRESRASLRTGSPPDVIHSKPFSPMSLPRQFASAPGLSLFDIVDADPYEDDR